MILIVEYKFLYVYWNLEYKSLDKVSIICWNEDGKDWINFKWSVC